MIKGMVGSYIKTTVVLNKSDIKNAKNEDFTEVSIFINEDNIRQW